MEELINQAVANKDWLAVGLASVLLIVPVVLKALGKDVPWLDPVLAGLKKLLTAKVKAEVVPPPAEGEKTGIAAVVPIKPEEKP
jgi:hypothetical protein